MATQGSTLEPTKLSTASNDSKKDKKSLGNLFRFVALSRKYAWLMAAGMVTGWMRMVLGLVMPLFYQRVIDDVLGGEGISYDERWSMFWNMVFWLGMILIMHLFASLGRNYFPAVVSANTIRDIRFRLYAHLQRLSLGFHNQRPTGTIVARLMNDVNSAQNVFSIVLIWGTQALLVITAIGIYMFWTDWQWALVCFSTLPIFVLTTRLLRRPMRQANREMLETLERLSGRVQERMAMIREVQAFTAEEYEKAGVLEDVEQLRTTTIKQRVLSGILVAATEITRVLAGIVLIGFGAYRVLEGDAKVGVLIAFYLYLNELLRPAEALTLIYGQAFGMAAAADRLYEFWDKVPVIRNKPNARPLAVDGSARVDFEGVTFSYPTDNPTITLSDVSFRAEPGWKVVLVGESGAGKSTLMSILPRFYDIQKGSIKINGQEIRDVTLESLRGSIGIVPQEPLLFSGTIRENIQYGRQSATFDEIQKAARDANADSFIKELPEGYESFVGERGIGLSGGQIQRIAIARAFLKDPQILILDEATSNLDATSEELVLEAIERLAAGRTTFMIAHRLSVARGADCILVLQEGKIVESGKHNELLEKDGAYAVLWNRQMQQV